MNRKVKAAALLMSCALLSGCLYNYGLSLGVAGSELEGDWKDTRNLGITVSLHADGTADLEDWPSSLHCDGLASNVEELEDSQRQDLTATWEPPSQRDSAQLYVRFPLESCVSGFFAFTVWYVDEENVLCASLDSKYGPDAATYNQYVAFVKSNSELTEFGCGA